MDRNPPVLCRAFMVKDVHAYQMRRYAWHRQDAAFATKSMNQRQHCERKEEKKSDRS